MTTIAWLQLALFGAILLAAASPVGWYLVKVYDGSFRWLGFIERPLYRVMGIAPDEDQHWSRYAVSLLVFSLVTMLVTYIALRLQHVLPLNPDGLAAVPDRQAFETAASFLTNTNWQSYGGETTMSYLSQMSQLAFHNFVSAAVGMGVAVALVRGIARQSASGIGNFWTDLVRGTLYILVPASLILALVFVQNGVVQTFEPALTVETLDGGTQIIARGPVASQESIKQLGTNGGGFFNANAAHPFENPTPFTNLLSIVAIFLIPAAATSLLGRMTGRRRHGWAVLAAMAMIFLPAAYVAISAETGGNPIHEARGVSLLASDDHAGGNMEGKEVRFGTIGSALYAVVTTAASCGAVNSMHDSFTPIGGMVPLVLMQLGEVVFGGVGAGLYGMIVMVVLTVFMAGLMVGRTPDYLGKSIQGREVIMAMMYVLIFPLVVLGFTAVAIGAEAGLMGRTNLGPHGLSEILYAFTSTAANNGSAFAGLSGGSDFYNTLFGVATLIGRFALIVPALALAGALAERRTTSDDTVSFPVDTPLFVVTLVGVIIILGALTYFPVLTLGPIVEHFAMITGRLF